MSMAWTRELDEPGVVRLAELLALKFAAGDVVALSGELGAGKTTFARALIGALLREGVVEVPSPTFSLAQAYATRRLTITHFDFYRLASAEDARELGLEEAMDNGAVIVEWPERAPTLLPASRYEVELAETGDPATRSVTMRGHGDAVGRNVGRIGELMAFLGQQQRWQSARIAYLQGDASTRGYARLHARGGTSPVMDAPRQPDGRDPRWQILQPHSPLAEDMVRRSGPSAPCCAPRASARLKFSLPISTRGSCWSRTWATGCSAPSSIWQLAGRAVAGRSMR